MCCNIFAGVEQNARVEAGLDFTKSFAGNFTDEDFFEQTFGP